MSETPDAPPDRYTEIAEQYGARWGLSHTDSGSFAALLRSLALDMRRDPAHAECHAIADRLKVQLEAAHERARVYMDGRNVVERKLAEARTILEHIIYASDRCYGHRGCGHGMEPWQEARAFLAAQPKTEP